MKNLLILIGMLAFTTSYATIIKPVPFSKNVTTIQFQNVKKGNTLSIKSQDDESLYTEEVKIEGMYIQYFDLSTLDNGSYIIELEKDSEIRTRHFEISDGKINYSRLEETIFYKPVASMRTNQLFVSKFTTTKESLEVQIYYNGTLIHEDSLTEDSVLSRVYQLDHSKKGSYMLSMKSNNREYYNYFTL